MVRRQKRVPPRKKTCGITDNAKKAGASGPQKAILLALKELEQAPQPRARMRLRAVMRKIGLDEWRVAWLLAFKIHCLAQSTTSSDNKLLLDYLKEAARHLDPASPRVSASDTSAIELVHDVPRPGLHVSQEQ